MMPLSPCKRCLLRYEGCHDKCIKYATYKIDMIFFEIDNKDHTYQCILNFNRQTKSIKEIRNITSSSRFRNRI